MADRRWKPKMIVAWLFAGVVAYSAVTAPARPLGAALVAAAFGRFFWREYRIPDEETSWTTYAPECVLGLLGVFFW